MTTKDGYKGQEAINLAMGERIYPTPSNGNAYDPEQYAFEKVVGKRTRTGQLKLRKLTARHKNVIALHLRGLSGRDIALVTGLGEAYVYAVIRDPLSQEIITGYLEGVDEELKSLGPMAVDAIRSGLGSDKEGIRLRAADHFFRATGKYAKAEGTGETAEDVLARALARVAVEQSSQLREVRREPPVKLIDGTATRRSEDEAGNDAGDKEE